MVHWDSSTRPLFVRTVWRDGQHHVLLQKEDADEFKRPLKSRRMVISASGKSSARSESSNTGGSSNFKVSSVKLLLNGVKGFKSDKRVRCQSPLNRPHETYTIDVVPSNPVYYQNINKDVTFRTHQNKQNSKSCYPTKSSSFDVHDTDMNENDYCLNDYGIGITPCFTYDSRCGNNLSERVLIWLDLATNSTNFQSSPKECNKKNRVVTALPQPVIQKRHAVPKPLQEIYRLDAQIENCNLQVHKIKPEPIDVTPRNLEEPAKEIEEVPISMEKCISSKLEENYCILENESEAKSNCICTTKRQLHIFMPNLPSKFSDSESLLSSKCSSVYKSVLSNYK